MERDLTRGGVVRTVLAFALPLALGMAAHAAFNLMDLWIVGSLGESAVAAVHLGSTINFFPMILGNGISVGTVVLVAQWLGSGRRERAARFANLACLVMVVVAVVTGVACWYWAPGCVAVLGGTGASVRVGIEYLEIVSLGTVTMFLLMHVTGLLRAMGNATWTLVLLIGSNALNIGLDFALIFGVDALGLPPQGAAGAAWATVIARALGCVAGLWILSHRASPLRPGFRLPVRACHALGRMVALGLPQSVQMLARASLVVTLTSVAGTLGRTSAQAAFGVVTRLDTLVLFAGVGWASGATAMVGQCVGHRLAARARRVAFWTMLFAGAFAALLAGAFALNSETIGRALVPDGSVEFLRHGATYLAIATLAHPPATGSLVLAGALNGAGSALLPMWLDVVAFVVVLQPAIWLWVQRGAAGGLSVCWGMSAAANWLLLVAYLVVLRRRGLRVDRSTAKLAGAQDRG